MKSLFSILNKKLDMNVSMKFYQNSYVFWSISNPESVTRRWSVKKVFLKISQNLQEYTYARVSLIIKLQANFIKKETPAKMFFCELCEIFNNIFFTEHLWAKAAPKWLLKDSSNNYAKSAKKHLLLRPLFSGATMNGNNLHLHPGSRLW